MARPSTELAYQLHIQLAYIEPADLATHRGIGSDNALCPASDAPGCHGLGKLTPSPVHRR